MLRRFLFVLGMLAVSAGAWAGEAAHVVFVTGAVQTGNRDIVNNDTIHEGDEIRTGTDGYVYLKTIDDGFLILRPSSVARIVSYSVDAEHPQNSQFKLELIKGVARSISGQGVKQARQNFRFNTPVAAIGVRGTDFTVFTDQETTRVAVISGGIVVSGFHEGCGREGSGPCEGKASRDLFASQVGQLLQISRGQSTPQLVRINANAPDAVAPPRGDEPATKPVNAAGNVTSVGDVNLDAQKGANLVITPVNAPPVKPVLPVVPPVVPPAVPPVVTPPPVAPQQIIWGRWQTVLNQPTTIDLKSLVGKSTEIGTNNYFAMFRLAGGEWNIPQQGSIGFSLANSEAYVLNETDYSASKATVDNGKLTVDFGSRSFTTSLDLHNQNHTYNFYANGSVGASGLLFGDDLFKATSNMQVNGALSPENGGRAGYLFQGRIDANHVASGATYWTH